MKLPIAPPSKCEDRMTSSEQNQEPINCQVQEPAASQKFAPQHMAGGSKLSFDLHQLKMFASLPGDAIHRRLFSRAGTGEETAGAAAATALSRI